MDAFALALLVLVIGFVATWARALTEQHPREPSVPVGVTPRAVPPPGISLLVGGHLTLYRRRSATAQLTELVRRGVLRVHGATVHRVGDGLLDPMEQEFVRALLNGATQAELRAEDPELARRIEGVQAAVNRHLLDTGLRHHVRKPRSRWWLRGTVLGLAVIGAALAWQDPRAWFVPLALGLFALIDPTPGRHWPLTDRGTALRDELLGVQQWLRSGDHAPDLATLHPWAVLFGQLDRWRARGGVEDPQLRALLIELGGDRPERGYADELPGDVWGAQATGGSRSVYDGATLPVTD